MNPEYVRSTHTRIIMLRLTNTSWTPFTGYIEDDQILRQLQPADLRMDDNHVEHLRDHATNKTAPTAFPETTWSSCK